MRAYRPHDDLIGPARASADLRRLAGGVVTLVVATLFLSTILASFLRSLPGSDALTNDILDGRTVLGMTILLGSFGLMVVALAAAMRVAHGRGPASLMGPGRLAWAQARRVLFYCGAVYAVVALLPLPGGLEAEPAMALGRWLGLLPLSLGLLVVQCGAEELVFRGYLQSQLAARFRSPVIWIGVPSAIFGLLHHDRSVYGAVAPWVALWSALFGMMLADLTARSGTLGPAIALHLLNNFLAIALAAPQGDLDGLALMTLPFAPDDAGVMAALLPLEAGVMLCAWLAARLALRA